MDWERTLQALIGFMKRAEGMGNTGADKKRFVIQSMTTVFNLDEEHKMLLIYLIELIIQLDKNKVKIKQQISNCCWG